METVEPTHDLPGGFGCAGDGYSLLRECVCGDVRGGHEDASLTGNTSGSSVCFGCDNCTEFRPKLTDEQSREVTIRARERISERRITRPFSG